MTGEPGEQLVPGGVAVAVVDPLEVVEIEHHERDRHVAALDELELPFALFVEGALVAQTGDDVDIRLGRHLLVPLGQFAS